MFPDESLSSNPQHPGDESAALPERKPEKFVVFGSSHMSSLQ